MGIDTSIEWADSTLNLQMGCDGCELWNPTKKIRICYSGVLHERYAGRGSSGYPESFDKPKLFLHRLDEAERWPDLTGKSRVGKPWLNGMPRMIFLDDMGDTFTESLPLDWLAPLLPRMAALPHIWMLLTKRANRMLRFSQDHPFPTNFWLMTSVTSSANYNRIEQLMQCRGGSIRGISYEPSLGPIDVRRWPGLDWVIGGGASGADAAPSNLQWHRDARAQCREIGAKFFLKQLGANALVDTGLGLVKLRLSDRKGGSMNEWPEGVRTREVPEVRS